MLMRGYVDLDRVLEFVERALRHGVPTRVAYKRAAVHFGLPPEQVRSYHRAVAAR